MAEIKFAKICPMAQPKIICVLFPSLFLCEKERQRQRQTESLTKTDRETKTKAEMKTETRDKGTDTQRWKLTETETWNPDIFVIKGGTRHSYETSNVEICVLFTLLKGYSLS